MIGLKRCLVCIFLTIMLAVDCSVESRYLPTRSDSEMQNREKFEHIKEAVLRAIMDLSENDGRNDRQSYYDSILRSKRAVHESSDAPYPVAQVSENEK